MAQNLIRNPDFEVYYKCPSSYTQWSKKYLLIPDWTFPTMGTSDYFHKCNSGLVGVPFNYVGRSDPHSGSAYCGIISKGTNTNYREYLQTKLLLPLKKGGRYCIKFHYKLATMSKYGTNRLGVHFSQNEEQRDIETYLPLKPQVEHDTNTFMLAKTRWEEFCGVYHAKGGERYIIIGNFYPDEKTPVHEAPIGEIDTSYLVPYPFYYIDDVSLHPIENCFFCTCDSIKQINIKCDIKKVTNRKGNDGEILAKVTGGNAPYTYNWSNGERYKKILYLKSGIYKLIVTDKNGCKDSLSVNVPEPSGIEDIFNVVNIGEPVILKYIYFDFDKSVLLPESFDELNILLKLMNNYPKTLIEIRGHTDSKGSDEYNLELSDNRAKAVTGFLHDNGIAHNRVTYKGFGESMPIADNSHDEGRALNRRVEFVILKR